LLPVLNKQGGGWEVVLQKHLRGALFKYKKVLKRPGYFFSILKNGIKYKPEKSICRE